MLSNEQLCTFATDGFLVVRDAVPEPLLAAADAEIDRVVAADPPPDSTIGKHFWFMPPAELPAADAALRESPALALAEQLVAPHRLVHGYGHIQIALNIPPHDHRPGGPHIDGAHDPRRFHPFTMLVGIFLGDETVVDTGNLWVWPGSHLDHGRLFAQRGVDALRSTGGHSTLLNPPLALQPPVPVLGRRGDVLLAHYLLGHNTGGNLSEHVRRMLYYRLATEDIETRWERTMTDPLLEYAPVRNARTT